VLELTPAGATGAFGLNPTAASSIRVVIKRDAEKNPQAVKNDRRKVGPQSLRSCQQASW
jgi:hypothetical protein